VEGYDERLAPADRALLAHVPGAAVVGARRGRARRPRGLRRPHRGRRADGHVPGLRPRARLRSYEIVAGAGAALPAPADAPANAPADVRDAGATGGDGPDADAAAPVRTAAADARMPTGREPLTVLGR
jgi:hypothetical protein